jgi:2-polyprenyl-6-methoxyphenol hydroxylase-like FAD-dependent oxidoreductase
MRGMLVSEREVPVLVVGGSLVGLTTSALLASHGIRHMLVERHRGTAIHPRAASFHQRTMEIFRSLGLQQSVEAAAEREFVQNGALISVDALSGKELACFYRSYNEGVEGLSPTSRLFITQIGLEPVLRERALALGADHHYATELASFEQDDAGVVAVLRPRDGGSERRVRAKYMVAADGAHSFVRGQLGIGVAGRGSFADCVTIYFKADVRALIGDRSLSVVYVNQPGLLAFFRFSITGDAGFLAVFATFDKDGTRSHVDQSLSPPRCAALVRAALGVPAEFAVAIDDVQPWSASAVTATAFRQGRVFLAGDAAHLMPPTGGFGGNTGIADAHNLAWKLAMVLKGAAGLGLLDSYESERKPQCELIVEQAYARYVKRVDPSLPATNLAPLLDDAAMELGSVYGSDAIVDEEEQKRGATALLEDPRKPSGSPGTRVPHIILQRNGVPLSTHDLPDTGFVLLAGAGGRNWTEAGSALAAAGIPLKVHRIAPDGDLTNPDGRFEETLGIGAQGALLLRPDRVIGWRTRGPHANPRARLDEVMRRLTYLPTRAPVC